MILKQADNRTEAIATLERLLAAAPADHKTKVEQELRTVRAGIKGEEEAAYLIDFHFKDGDNWVVIHDLRLEINGRIAQIDHLLLNRCLDCYVLETKHFSSGFKITDEGEFLRWNHYRKAYEGMASPLAQNDRHVLVLRDTFEQIEMPARLGVRLSPTFHPLVLVSSNARIDRPRSFDTSRVIKIDGLRDAINKRVDKAGALNVVGSLARLLSVETLQGVGERLVALHQPSQFDFAARFGIAESESQPTKTPAEPAGPRVEQARCRGCGSENLSIQYGKFGYYFKCGACAGNTPIKLSCGYAGHSERLRKDGPRFYRECAKCKSSSLFFRKSASA